MTENRQHEPSPWAAPSEDGGASSEVVVPPAGAPVSRFLPSRPATGTTGASSDPVEKTPDIIGDDRSMAGSHDDRRLIQRFVAVAGALVAVAVVAAVALVATGTWRPLDGPVGPLADNQPAPDLRPPLARSCPPPSDARDPDLSAPPPAPAGPRTIDDKAGISYRAYGEPWTVWQESWRGGTLGVHYRIGQHFITETYTGGTYHASILSGSVPAAVNDGTALDLKCAGQAVTADVRAEYYPQPNRMQVIRNEATVLGSRPAWVSVFRLHFSEPGLTADNELVAVATINVGRPEAAILYVSIPGTHKQWDWVVEDVLRSVRPT